MNQEKSERFREACKYQKMAFKALFPERTARHMEVIAEELQAMLLEGMADCFREAFCGKTQERYSSEGWTMAEEGKTSGGASQGREGSRGGQAPNEGRDGEATGNADRDGGLSGGLSRDKGTCPQKDSKVKKITIG